MSVIGVFRLHQDGGWIGTIRTLTINVRARFVPNDNRENEDAPMFRVFAGRSEIGAAWSKWTNKEKPREFLSVRLDDPSLKEPIMAAMFSSQDGQEGRLIWSRKRSE